MLYKRAKTWHIDVVINGIRYRQSLQTTDWREARNLERERIKLLEKRTPDPHKRGKSYGSMTIEAALAVYIAERRGSGIAPDYCLLAGMRASTHSTLQETSLEGHHCRPYRGLPTLTARCWESTADNQCHYLSPATASKACPPLESD